MGLDTSIAAVLPDNTDEQISPADLRTALRYITASIDDHEDFSAAVAAAYQAKDSDLTTIAAANNGTVLAATTASFTTADETKLDGIEAAADVTDAANVAAAGAVMEGDTIPAASVDFGGGIDLTEAFGTLSAAATDNAFRILAPVDIHYSQTNFSNPTQSNARHLAGYLQSSGAQNAEVVYRLRGPLAAGTWTFRLTHSTNVWQGIYTIATSPDGSAFTDLTTVDGYASPAAAAVITDTTGLTVPADTAYIRLKMATKNASSSNYYGAFSAISGVRTA